MVIDTWEDFYCDEVLSGKTPVNTVQESEHSLAFYHTRPYYEIHIIVIPKKHIHSFLTLTDDEKEIMDDVLQILRDVAGRLEKEHGACTISTNIGNYQSNKHMHWHVHYGARIRDEKGRLFNGKRQK
ncbi:HIT family protein [Mesobacillus jeotgali]|uniref:HIT family protein n=1 Tax=Mesobacillus jeotgali TaxID=129985 RepID=UPI0009A5C6F2|nr:HIT domain-containing protein [Mesobacillus jeotgali]